MCGIAGYLCLGGSLDDSNRILTTMTEQLSHRGPDGCDVWSEGNVGLGHRRLAIIDLNTGDQPMWDAGHEQVIVFNGEIYNYPEIRKQLEARGHRFLTSSDTEMISAAIKEWGISEGLFRLRGMFAFSLFNTKTKRMILARDRAGIKPLYWLKKANVVYFASEMKALLIEGLSERRINPAALHDYLALGHTIAPSTCWSDIHFLPPGTWMEIGEGYERKETYWQWSPRPDEGVHEDQWLDQLETILSDSLRCHLLSDVPLGAFLSGGIDSSLAVALLMTHHIKELNTFNVAFDEVAYDESPFAQLVAAQYKTQHHQISVSSSRADADLLVKASQQFDEPFGDLASLPNYMLSQATAEHVKVVLSGDGGDEILGGYPFYNRMKQVEKFSNFSWADPVVHPILQGATTVPVAQTRKLFRAWEDAQGSPIERLVRQVSLYSEEKRSEMYTDAFRKVTQECGPTFTRIEKYVPSDITDPLDRMLTIELRIRLQSGYLRKVDITSSAHGLETRVPYLDNHMLEFAEVLPARYKIHGHQLKYLAYRLARRYLPEQLFNRPKHGFNFPYDRWSSTPSIQKFLQDLLLSPGARWRSFLKPDILNEPWKSFTGERKNHMLSREGAYARIYSLTSFELWLQKWQPSL